MNNNQKGMKYQMKGTTQAQQGMTLWTTLLSFCFLIAFNQSLMLLCVP
jgi:hypothetical protein